MIKCYDHYCHPETSQCSSGVEHFHGKEGVGVQIPSLAQTILSSLKSTDEEEETKLLQKSLRVMDFDGQRS